MSSDSESSSFANLSSSSDDDVIEEDEEDVEEIYGQITPYEDDVHNYIQRFVLQINEQFNQPKTRNPKHTIKNGEEARLKLETAARLP